MFQNSDTWSSSEVGKLCRVLSERTASLERLLDSLPQGVALLDHDGAVVYANRPFRLEQTDAPALLAELQTEWRAAAKERRPQGPVRTSSGWSVVLLPHEFAQVLLVFAARETGLPTSAAQPDADGPKLHMASLDCVAAPVAVLDGASHVVFANTAFRALTGYESAELAGKAYRDVHPSWDSGLIAGSGAAAGTLLHKAGSALAVTMQSRGASYQGRPVQVVTYTARLADAAGSTGALERVAGQVAHRLNNLLTVMLSYTELIEAEYGGVENLAPQLQSIKEAAQAATRITQDLLTFSGGRPVALTDTELDRAIAGMAGLLRNVAGEISVRLLLHAPGAQVRFGSKELETVLLHIVRNAKEAIGAGAAGSITVQTTRTDPASPDDRELLTRLGLPEGDYVKVSVIDTGSGYAPEHESALFEPFFTTKRGAAGMGLPISRGLLRRAGGGIEISRLATGTRVQVVLRDATSLTESEAGNDRL